MRRAVQRWVGVAAVVVAATGCRTRGQFIEATTPEAGPTAPAPVQGRRGAAVSPAVAAANSPVQLLPDTTAVVFTAAGLQALLGLVDMGTIIAKYRSTYDQAAAEVTRNAGVNLLDPTQWSSVGVDVAGPMGAAVVDLRSETIAGFMTLSDRDKFRAFVDRVSKGQMLPVLEDRGLVLKTDPDSSTALVLRDRYMFVVSTNRPAKAAYDFARALATIDPARGLTATPRFQSAMASNEPARPLTAYVDIWALIEAEYGKTLQPDEREASWVEQELDRAQASGAPQEELQRLRQQVDEERRWEAERRQRKQLQFDALTRMFRTTEPLVFEFTADAAGLRGRVRARMPETAVWRSVVRNAPMPSPLMSALGERPVLLAGGSIDVVQAKVLLDDLIRADGDDPAKEYAEFKAESSVDVERDLVPILSGTGGFAMTVSDALLRGEARRGAQELGFAAAIGVTSAERAQAIVDAAVQRVPRAKLGKDRKTGAHTLAMPDYRTVYVAVVAGHIVVTTDPSVIQRLGTGSQAAVAKLLAPAAVPVLTARDTAGHLMFDLLYPVFMMMGRRYSTETRRPEEPYSLFPEVAHAKIDGVPRSRAYKAKLRDWETTDAKIRREEEAEERRQLKAVSAIAEAFGVQAWHLREQPDGLVIEGGHFFGKGGVTRGIELAVEQFSGGRRSEKIWEMYSARSALEDELRRIRVAEVAQALGVPTPLQP